MPKERKKSLCMDTLRHAEYYGMLQTFDDLYAKSKSGEKFPNLMELILSQDNIMLAYRNIKSNTGSYTAGTDHQNIGDIGKLPPSVVIEKVRKIVTGSQHGYRPKPVRRKDIPKPNGKTRPLGIPCIWDRLIQQCMIYTQLIQTLYRQADRIHKGRLPVPVHCLMDEYANISLPKDTFLSALATMRSRAIFCSIIVQNMAQLKAMYKDDWESLVGLCDEFLYLGGTEKETHKYVSELLGKETISTTSYNQSKGRSGSYSINHQQSGRDLMTPDEVRLLDNSKCILFIRGERPVVDFKYNLLKHPNIRYTEDGGAAPYDYTAAGNALEDLPGAPENYELLDMDDFLPAEAVEMRPTIQRIRRST